MGSMFSIPQMMIQVSAESRITSNSISFQPSTLSSMSTWWMRERESPSSIIRASSSLVFPIPPPAPPSVYAGRTTAGSPTDFIASSIWLREFRIVLFGTGSPIRIMRSRNFSRSSPRYIASRGVPRISTSLSAPISASSAVRLSPVCPPIPERTPSGCSFSIIFAIMSARSGSMYMVSAISGSVWMVAGLEFTRTTLTPSSRMARQAWLPEKSNSAACPIWIGPDPIIRTFLIFCRLGIIRSS